MNLAVKKELTDQLRFGIPSEEFMKEIIEECEVKEDSNVCILSSDNGFLTYTMMNRAKSIHLFEEHESVLNQLMTKLGSKNTSYYKFDKNFTLEDNSMDFVFININEYNHDIYKECNRVLKNNGKIILFYINEKKYEDIIIGGENLTLGENSNELNTILNNMGFEKNFEKSLRTYKIHLLDDDSKVEEEHHECSCNHEEDHSCSCGGEEEEHSCSGCGHNHIPENAKQAEVEIKVIIAKK
ncbi:hypothetical protein OSSY52_21610 [Tepiditoga spiralis]|uniref:Methyltransferase type 11 domain-containing protein n=1 Tax=Tepiditoga spiralis TaxID=2108365 RepID=A0A7G1G5Y1_9BACT|nr:hypothetical protein [Tepiditoga spiralis]BBE32020.1 hypothetical protein OSSY52_21610 [Tepiditoga spiralis]